MNIEETESARLDAVREAYDDAIDALAKKYGKMQDHGHYAYTESSGGFWPFLLIEGRRGPYQIVTFRGFCYDFGIIVPREKFDDFFREALAHLESYPADAYGKGNGQA